MNPKAATTYKSPKILISLKEDSILNFPARPLGKKARCALEKTEH